MNAAAFRPAFRQFGLGLAIFATVLAVSLPLAFIDEGLALGAAVGVASIMIALLARRLHIALMIAALLAVLGAFGTAHSIHLAMGHAPVVQRLAQLSPAAGPSGYAAAASALFGERATANPVSMVLPAQAAFVANDGTRTSLPLPGGWALPAALFALWTLGYALVATARLAAKRLNRALVTRV